MAAAVRLCIIILTITVVTVSGCSVSEVGGGNGRSSSDPPCVGKDCASTKPPRSSSGHQPTSNPAIAEHLVFGDPDTSGLDHWPGMIDVAPIVHDLNGDGVDEIIVQSNDTKVYVFDAEGHVMAQLPTTYPSGWFIERVLNQVAAGRLRPDEPPSLVVTDHAAYVAVWRVDPDESDRDTVGFEKMWEKRMDGCFGYPGMDAKATLADLDNDGSLEILVQTEEVGFFALYANGTEMWRQCWAGGNSSPVAADLDGDGKLEVIVASDDGLVSVLIGKTGQPLWSFNAALHVKPGAISVEPTVADLDGQGEKEILFTARVVPSAEPDTWPYSHMAIFAVHRNPQTWQAELVWMLQPDWANPLSYTHLAVLDVDADGRMDIFGMDWNTVGHSPGKWQRLGPSHVFRLEADGNEVWMQEVDAWWANKDIAIADADGDGSLDVLVNGPAPEGHDSIISLDAATGQPRNYLGIPGWQVMRGVILTDLRHDGGMQVIFPVLPTTPPTRGAILLFELDVPFRAPWPGY